MLSLSLWAGEKPKIGSVCVQNVNFSHVSPQQLIGTLDATTTPPYTHMHAHSIHNQHSQKMHFRHTLPLALAFSSKFFVCLGNIGLPPLMSYLWFFLPNRVIRILEECTWMKEKVQWLTPFLFLLMQNTTDGGAHECGEEMCSLSVYLDTVSSHGCRALNGWGSVLRSFFIFCGDDTDRDHSLGQTDKQCSEWRF